MIVLISKQLILSRGFCVVLCCIVLWANVSSLDILKYRWILYSHIYYKNKLLTIQNIGYNLFFCFFKKSISLTQQTICLLFCKMPLPPIMNSLAFKIFNLYFKKHESCFAPWANTSLWWGKKQEIRTPRDNKKNCCLLFEYFLKGDEKNIYNLIIITTCPPLCTLGINHPPLIWLPNFLPSLQMHNFEPLALD